MLTKRNSTKSQRQMREMLDTFARLKANQSRPARAPRQRNRTAGRKNQISLPNLDNLDETHCAHHYGEALLDPFNTPAGACVPKFPSINSSKRVLFAKGTGSCVAGNGGIVITPNCSNNTNSVWFSQTGWVAGAPGDMPNGGDVGVGTITGMNGSFAAADFAATPPLVQSRLVSLGVRIRYIGTKLNEGGRVYLLEEPDHETLAGENVTVIRSYDDCVAADFDKHWKSITYQPRYPPDFAFTDERGQTKTDTFLAISIQSAFATAAFEWEVYGHWEFIGRSVRGKTVSHSAPLLADRILSGISQMPRPLMIKKATQPLSVQPLVRGVAKSGASFWQRMGRLGGGLLSIGGSLMGNPGLATLGGGLTAMAA